MSFTTCNAQLYKYASRPIMFLGVINGPIASFVLVYLVLRRPCIYAAHRTGLLVALKLLRTTTATTGIVLYEHVLFPIPDEEATTASLLLLPMFKVRQ